MDIDVNMSVKNLWYKPGGVLIFVICLLSHAYSIDLGEREEIDLPLASLKLRDKNKNTELKPVRVSFERRGDYFVISPSNDIKAEITRHGYKKTVYREHIEYSDILTDFEAEILDRVVETLIETLELLEEIIKKRQWSKARFLDSYFPKFLNNYYYLVCSAKGSEEALPGVAKIPERAYEVSRSSIKTDYRINKWKSSNNHLIKLGISAKELRYQLNEWQDKCLDNRKRNKNMDYSYKAGIAYGRFIRMYFNLAD